MKGFENLDFKLKHAEQTLVFEKIGNPEKEREFELRSLRDWGFDLLLVWNRGRLTYLLQDEGLRKKGARRMSTPLRRYCRSCPKIPQYLQRWRRGKEGPTYWWRFAM